MHLTVRLPPAFPDQAIAAAANAYGMAISPLSGFSLAPTAQDNGLVIGYGNTAPELYGSLLARLAKLAHELARA